MELIGWQHKHILDSNIKLWGGKSTLIVVCIQLFCLTLKLLEEKRQRGGKKGSNPKIMAAGSSNWGGQVQTTSGGGPFWLDIPTQGLGIPTQKLNHV